MLTFVQGLGRHRFRSCHDGRRKNVFDSRSLGLSDKMFLVLRLGPDRKHRIAMPLLETLLLAALVLGVGLGLLLAALFGLLRGKGTSSSRDFAKLVHTGVNTDVVMDLKFERQTCVKLPASDVVHAGKALP